MNTKITIQKHSVNCDEIGNRKNAWQDYFTCFATVSGEMSSEKEVAGHTEENYTLSFTIRYCKKIKDISSVEYRVVMNDKVFNILNVDHMGYKKKCVKLKCKKENVV